LPRRAIIAGAGIGGLSTAIALLQAGFRVVIYERATALEEFGAGLQITPNATRVLSQLGVLEQTLRFASKPNAVLVLKGSDDTELMRMPLDGAVRRWGAEYFVIHRADLQRALLDALLGQSGVEISFGTTVLDFVEDGGGLSVGLTSSQTHTRDRADLLIGADGIRSQIRDQLGFGAQDQVKFTGRVAYRAIVSADHADPQWMRDEVILRLGSEAHLVQYALRRGSMINLVATIRSALPGAAYRQEYDAASLSNLERAFAGWSKIARSLTNAPIQWRGWPIYSRLPISAFSRGRVALAGDAAHPMVPFLAQGAAQAIEDAGALARILAQVQDIPEAVSLYSRNRVERATRVQREALKLGRIYHMSGPLAFARDTTMQLLGSRGLIQRYDWLYGA
jgi:salicylate hydroxylase